MKIGSLVRPTSVVRGFVVLYDILHEEEVYPSSGYETRFMEQSGEFYADDVGIVVDMRIDSGIPKVKVLNKHGQLGWTKTALIEEIK